MSTPSQKSIAYVRELTYGYRNGDGEHIADEIVEWCCKHLDSVLDELGRLEDDDPVGDALRASALTDHENTDRTHPDSGEAIEWEQVDGCPSAPVEVRIDLSVMSREHAVMHLREWAEYILKGGSGLCFGGDGMGSLSVRERDVSRDKWEDEFMQWWESRERGE